MKNSIIIGAALSCSFLTINLAHAQEPTQTSVAFRGANGNYISTPAGGGLDTSATKITGRETFLLIDLNGGALQSGDTVQINWQPVGAKPTYWAEGQTDVYRVPTKPKADSVFTVQFVGAPENGAPQTIALKTASGKWVAASSNSNKLGLSATPDGAAQMQMVIVPKVELNVVQTPATTASATPATPPAPDAPATNLLDPGATLPAPVSGMAPLPADFKPTIWLIGDSTVNNSNKTQMGWGKPIGNLFDPNKAVVQNKARGGRSSRSFLTEGLWADVLKQIQPGDFVLMQFGHNDGGKPEGVYPQGRASLRGAGDDSREVDTQPGQREVVYSFGWYLRRYIADARAKGATPIVLSMIPRNDWQDGKVLRAASGYGGWAREAAQEMGAPFVDLNEITAKKYEALGQEKVAAFFPDEHTHTNEAGATINAQSVVEGLKALPNSPFSAWVK